MESLRIACKALSLDTPPTIPVIGPSVCFVECVSQRLAIATVNYVQATPYNLRMYSDVIRDALIASEGTV